MSTPESRREHMIGKAIDYILERLRLPGTQHNREKARAMAEATIDGLGVAQLVEAALEGDGPAAQHRAEAAVA